MPTQKRIKNFKISKPKEVSPDALPPSVAGCKYLFAEPKLDGLRGIAIIRDGKCKLYTSTGVRVKNGPSIKRAVKVAKIKNCVLDGEYFSQDWNTTNSLVKTQTKHPKRNRLHFRVFDILTLKEWDTQVGKRPLSERKDVLNKLGKKLRDPMCKGIRTMTFTRIKPDLKLMENYFKGCVQAGHEGAVFKNPDAVYAFKKSHAWLKWKPFQSADLKIITIQEGTGKYKGKLGAIIVEGHISKKLIKTKVGGGFTDKQRDDYWKLWHKHKLAGRIAEIRHEGATVHGAVRFPRFMRLRGFYDKDKPD